MWRDIEMHNGTQIKHDTEIQNSLLNLFGISKIKTIGKDDDLAFCV